MFTPTAPASMTARAVSVSSAAVVPKPRSTSAVTGTRTARTILRMASIESSRDAT